MNDATQPDPQYPDGKLNEDDKGALAIAVGPDNGCVRVQFAKSVTWIALPPDEALGLCDIIRKHALALMEPQGGRQ